MSIDDHEEVNEYVWERLPMRKHLFGRRAVRRMTSFAVNKCRMGQQVGDIEADICADAKEQQYGMGIILTLVLSALVSEVVKLVIQWIKERRSHEQR